MAIKSILVALSNFVVTYRLLSIFTIRVYVSSLIGTVFFSVSNLQLQQSASALH